MPQTYIPQGYEQKFARSRELFQQALQAFPSGVVHEGRFMEPFNLFYSHAQGSHKWEVTGNRLIDYNLGQAALLLGHRHPEVVKAIAQQLESDYHFGQAHPLEVEWAGWVQRLIPSAERLRFVNSGTEATMLAMRLARAFTGKTKVMRFQGHYNGWHDYAMMGLLSPYDIPASAGVPQAVTESVVVAPSHDIEAVERIFERDGDIAAAILEPSGPSWGQAPLPPGFLQALRDITRAHGALLIFDEVITGFRWSPGGAQALFGIIPDLTTMGKVVSGAMPGAAVACRADVIETMAFSGDSQRDRYQRAYHAGTYNGNPLAAAAGIATLKVVATGEPQRRANEVAKRIREGWNEVLNRLNVEGCVYGEMSTFHTFFGPCPRRTRDDEPLWTYDPAVLKGTPSRTVWALHQALQMRGVDLMSRMGGVTSLAHTDQDVQETVDAFEGAVKELLEAGVISRR